VPQRRNPVNRRAAIPASDGSLTRYDSARKALQAAHSVDEVKQILDQAAAVAEYARRAKDGDLIAWATAIQQDAARKAGRMLAEMRAAGERRLSSDPSNTVLPALADLGVSKMQSHRWQALAALDDAAFEARKANACRAVVASVEMTREERQADKKARRTEREAELGAKIAAFPDRRYGVIVADPAWKFEPWSADTGMDRAADNHYPTSELGAIKALDVPSIAATDCALFLWATAPMLSQALDVMASWGFAYRSHCTWVKDRIGTGYWWRNAHELLLLGVRGAVPAPAMGEQWESVIEAPVSRHSAKPDLFLEMIESYFPSLPRIELNRRGPARENWDAWGNEFEQPDEAAE
jgi:N6-adenosine-specific RNA methylase IME4